MASNPRSVATLFRDHSKLTYPFTMQPYFDLAKADGQRYEKERAAAGLSD